MKAAKKGLFFLLFILCSETVCLAQTTQQWNTLATQMQALNTAAMRMGAGSQAVTQLQFDPKTALKTPLQAMLVIDSLLLSASVYFTEIRTELHSAKKAFRGAGFYQTLLVALDTSAVSLSEYPAIQSGVIIARCVLSIMLELIGLFLVVNRKGFLSPEQYNRALKPTQWHNGLWAYALTPFVPQILGQTKHASATASDSDEDHSGSLLVAAETQSELYNVRLASGMLLMLRFAGIVVSAWCMGMAMTVLITQVK